jgi:hypothetical protein
MTLRAEVIRLVFHAELRERADGIAGDAVVVGDAVAHATLEVAPEARGHDSRNTSDEHSGIVVFVLAWRALSTAPVRHTIKQLEGSRRIAADTATRCAVGTSEAAFIAHEALALGRLVLINAALCDAHALA